MNIQTINNINSNNDNVKIWSDGGSWWEHTANQGTDEWKEARYGRVTASGGGPLAGHSKFKTSLEQGEIIAGVKDDFFDDKAIELMSHGTDTEPDARSWYEKKYDCKVIERGLIVPKWDLTLGASVDGDVIGKDGIIEIKCPMKMYKPIETYMKHVSNGWKPPLGYHNHIWPTHYDQMIQGMACLGKKWCDYVVYCTPTSTVFTQRINFDQKYWEEQLYPKIKENYAKYVLPHLKNSPYPICPSYSDIVKCNDPMDIDN